MPREKAATRTHLFQPPPLFTLFSCFSHLLLRSREMSDWQPIELNDGRLIPAIGFGTWRIGNGEVVITQVDQALSTGFDHIDTAQIYQNESETGEALYLSGIPRNELWVTTKYSGSNPELGIFDSCVESLNKVRLYLSDIRSPEDY